MRRLTLALLWLCLVALFRWAAGPQPPRRELEPLPTLAPAPPDTSSTPVVDLYFGRE